MKSVGQQLREAREARKWTPQAAAKISKIKLERLLDLENDDYSRFAGPAYARGFVRLYARTLGLDERRLSAQLDGHLDSDEEHQLVAAPVVEYVPESARLTAPMSANRVGSAIIFSLLGIILLIIVIELYRIGPALHHTTPSTVSTQHEKEKSPASPSAQKEIPVAKAVPAESLDAEVKRAEPVNPEPAKRAEPVNPSPSPVANPPQATPAEPVVKKAEPIAVPVTPVTPATHKLILSATEDCWVRVSLTGDGQASELFADVIKAGEKKEFQGAKFLIKMRNPSVVNINFDNEDLGTYSTESTPAEFTCPAD